MAWRPLRSGSRGQAALATPAARDEAVRALRRSRQATPDELARLDAGLFLAA
jgi:hypothetical protein